MFAIDGQAFCGSGPGVFRLCCCSQNRLLVSRGGTLYLLSDADGLTLWSWLAGSTIAPAIVAFAHCGSMSMSATKAYIPFGRNAAWQGSDGAMKTCAVLNLTDGSVQVAVDTGSSATSALVLPDGSFVVGGLRNNGWPSSGGAFRSLFKFDAFGTLSWSIDIGGAHSVTSLSLASDGNIIAALDDQAGVNLARIRASDGFVLALIASGSSSDEAFCVDSRVTDEVAVGSTGRNAPASGRINGWTNSLGTNLYASAAPGVLVGSHQCIDIACAVDELNAADYLYVRNTGPAVSKIDINTMNTVAWGGSGGYGSSLDTPKNATGGLVVADRLRSTSWPGSGGQIANCWRWEADGSLRWFLDLAPISVGTTCVCGGPSYNL